MGSFGQFLEGSSWNIVNAPLVSGRSQMLQEDPAQNCPNDFICSVVGPSVCQRGRLQAGRQQLPRAEEPGNSTCSPELRKTVTIEPSFSTGGHDSLRELAMQVKAHRIDSKKKLVRSHADEGGPLLEECLIVLHKPLGRHKCGRQPAGRF